MKRISLSLFIALAVIVSACSAQVNTAANTASPTTSVPSQTVTPTVASILPTEAPALTSTPTDTPVPTAVEAPTEVPTLEAAPATATPVSTAGNSDCIKPLQNFAGGKPTTIKIENNSGFPISISLFLEKNAFGDCGYRGYELPKNGSTIINDLIQGCYSASVVINNPKKSIKAFTAGCINNTDKWSFIVLKDSMSLQGR
jgi:hypothetical protein